MSYKIYDAFKTSAGLGAILKAAQAARREARAAWVGKFKSVMSEMENPADGLRLAAIVESQAARGLAALNPECSIAVFPYPGRNRRKAKIVQAFGLADSGRDVQRALVKRIRGDDFHYQNSTDKPDGVSESEWRERYRVWMLILSGSGVPCESGLNYDIIAKREASEIALEAFYSLHPPEGGWRPEHIVSGPGIMAAFSSSYLRRASESGRGMDMAWRSGGNPVGEWVAENSERVFGKRDRACLSLDSSCL